VFVLFLSNKAGANVVKTEARKEGALLRDGGAGVNEVHRHTFGGVDWRLTIRAATNLYMPRTMGLAAKKVQRPQSSKKP